MQHTRDKETQQKVWAHCIENDQQGVEKILHSHIIISLL